ncbi:MAG: TIGR01777 family oxidoreductase [Verrucomicrobiota bacterium]
MKPERCKIILSGGSGFLGQTLATWFAARNYAVVVITRSPRHQTGPIRDVFWDGKTVRQWAEELEGAVAVINLAGRSVDCRYHARNRKEILDSRIDSTRAVGEAIRRCKTPPRVWINASTGTIYGHTFEMPMDEAGAIWASPEAKDEFSIDVAKAWEAAFNEAETPLTRKITLRMAMVLGTTGNSVFPMLRRLARLGLGGKMASGRQFVSWIHHEDFCRAIEWLIDHENFSGVVNVAAPNPLSNREMMRIFRRVSGVPIGLPAPLWLLEIGTFMLRTETELVIKSRRVIPKRLEDAGFTFRFRKMEEAVRALEKEIEVGEPG